MKITLDRYSMDGGEYVIEGDTIEDAVCKNWETIIRNHKPGGAAGYHLEAVYVQVDADRWVSRITARPRSWVNAQLRPHPYRH